MISDLILRRVSMDREPAFLTDITMMKVKNWKQWERTLIEGPFIHHAGMIYGHYADAVVEACKYIPGLEPVRME